MPVRPSSSRAPPPSSGRPSRPANRFSWSSAASKIDLLRKTARAGRRRCPIRRHGRRRPQPGPDHPGLGRLRERARGRPMRGIGEPIWAERSPAELVECQRHESLLNVAFAGSAGFYLMCPYDTTSLGPGRRSPRPAAVTRSSGGTVPDGISPAYPGIDELCGPVLARPCPSLPARRSVGCSRPGRCGPCGPRARREATAAGFDARTSSATW